MADIYGKIIYRIRTTRLRLLQFYSTYRMETELLIKRVTTGKGVRFWGTSFVVRFPQSSITIGDRCAFRSDKSSNLIGINRKCMLSTHHPDASITIGEGCGFSGTVIGAKSQIRLGNQVLCGANTLITDFDWHGVHPTERRTTTGEPRPITIGNNVFIGYSSVVLKGVTIGDNSVIAANSVVTRDIPANVIAGGNPCKVIKHF